MRAYFLQRWFLLLLLALIVAGHSLGFSSPRGAASVAGLFSDQFRAWLVAAILFCMSVTLDGRRFRQALYNPGPVMWALTVSVGLMPLAAAVLVPWQPSPDFAIGLMITASVPCTLAAATVWTRRAGGNDAVSLLVTLITNTGCVLFTPFWLDWLSGEGAELDVQVMIRKLVWTALLPTAAGQLARLVPTCAAAADRWKIPLGVAAQLGVLSIVFSSACDGGARMANGHTTTAGEHAAPHALAVVIVTISCIALHLGAMGVGLLGSRLFRFTRGDAIAIAFAASQKTLPIGVLIATDLRLFGGEYPWAVFPILIFHTCQLLIDTPLAERMARAKPDSGLGAPVESVTIPS